MQTLLPFVSGSREANRRVMFFPDHFVWRPLSDEKPGYFGNLPEIFRLREVFSSLIRISAIDSGP